MQSRLQQHILIVKQQWLCSLLCCRFKMLFLCNFSNNHPNDTACGNKHPVNILLFCIFICQVWNMSHIFMLCLGVKPYACTMCDMRFIQRYQLERHSLTHTGMFIFFASPWSCMCYTWTNIYMAASNSSLYCFSVTIFSNSNDSSLNNESCKRIIIIFAAILCIWNDMMTMTVRPAPLWLSNHGSAGLGSF